jgi:HK97 family phage portal protein
MQGGSDPGAYMRAYGSSGTVFSIVSMLARQTAKVPWHLYRQTPQDGRVRYTTGDKGSDQRVEVVQHLAMKLWNRPNAAMSGFQLRELCQTWLDLTGESYIICQRDGRATFPTALWPARPDRMEPIPGTDKFLAGYVYRGPSGEAVPLQPDEVVMVKYPNPFDVYRGLGPIQSILVDIDASKYSAQWNRNFFLNSATPGGVIQVDKRLSDEEWNEFTNRWRETHRGVGAAHRVAVLEQGAIWVPNAHSMRDMDFTGLRNISRDVIREAFAMHKAILGTVDDVNRANAQTAQELFEAFLIADRLDRWRDVLNCNYLPLFGSTGEGVELDHDDPVQSNREADALELKSKASAAEQLVAAGYDPHDVLETVGLPDMGVVEKATQLPALPPGWVPGTEPGAPGTPGEDGVAAPDGSDADSQNRSRPRIVARGPRNAVPTAPEHDLTDVDRHWKAAVTLLVTAYLATVVPTQRAQLADQIRQAVDDGDITGLADLDVDSGDGANLLLTSMTGLASTSAKQAAKEAGDQGADVDPQSADDDTLRNIAVAVAALQAAQLVLSARSEATRLSAAGDADGEDVAAQVDTFLAGLSDDYLTGRLAGAMSAAQNESRIATFLAGPSADLFASEVNDRATCLMPETLVTTDRGQIPASEVRLTDRMLTHSGRWVAPSQIPKSLVDEDVVVLELADGRKLRATYDHHLLVVENGVLVWREARELAAGALLIDQSTLQEHGELVVPDLILGQAPHNVATADQISRLALVNVRAQRVPVTTVGLNDDSLVKQEIDNPGAYRGLSAEGYLPALQKLADDAFDAGLQPAGDVAPWRAVTTPVGLARDGAELGITEFAGHDDGRPSTSLTAVASVLGLPMTEGRAAALAYAGPPARIDRTPTRAVGVAVRHGDGHLEADAAVRADLADAVVLRANLGPDLRIGVLARDGAVDGSRLVAARDLVAADLAVSGRELGTPAFAGGVGPTTQPFLDADTALDTRLIHNVSVLQVRQSPYTGIVYDFTIPGDETFWAEGVLVHNCKPCQGIDGEFIGNTADENINDALDALYPTGGYIDCAGKDRCRGTVIAAYSVNVESGGDSGGGTSELFDAASGRIAAAKDAAAKAIEQTAKNFPPEAMAWMYHAAWTGPVNVPLSHIDFDADAMDLDGNDGALIGLYAQRLKDGKKLKPVLLVKTPKVSLLVLPEGHHRYLATVEAGEDKLRAFIGTVDSEHGGWETMHAQQFGTSSNEAKTSNVLPFFLVGLDSRVPAAANGHSRHEKAGAR